MRRYLFISLALCAFIISILAYRITTRPQVSVVMSTYNRASLLPRVINSVLNQTYSDFEFIIIDDGSSDNTIDVIRYFQNKDSRIILVRNKKNKGLIASLNRGIDKARGNYIARIDDDDAMLSTRLEKQVAYFQKHPETTVLATGYYAYKYDDNQDGKKIRKRIHLGCPSPTEQVFVNMMRGNGLAHSTTMIDRNYLMDKNLRYHPDFKSAEDYRLWFDVLSSGGQIHCLQDPLTEYTRAGNNPSSFYENMANNTKKVQVLFLSLLSDNAQELNQKTECEISRELVIQNATKKIVNQKLLSQKIKENCPPDDKTAIEISHPFWKDYFILTDNGKRLYRYQNPKQSAQILSFKNGQLVIKWDSQGKEKFTCDTTNKKCMLINE